MPNDVTQVGLVSGVAALINVVAATREKRDVVPIAVASGISYFALVLVGGLSKRWELAVAFAWVFLIGTLLVRGMPLLQTVAEAINAPPPTRGKTPTTTDGRRTSSGTF